MSGSSMENYFPFIFNWLLEVLKEMNTSVQSLLLNWAAPFKIDTPPVEDFGKVHQRGVGILNCTHPLSDFYIRFIREGINIVFRSAN